MDWVAVKVVLFILAACSAAIYGWTYPESSFWSRRFLAISLLLMNAAFAIWASGH